MESKGFISKPLALVIIGVIIGASLGLGSGYAIIFPQLVKEQNYTMEEKLDNVESSIESLNFELVQLNHTLEEMQGDFQTVSSLAQAINNINSRIIVTENSITNLDVKLDGFEDEISMIYMMFSSYDEQWASLVDDFENLEDIVISFDSKIKSLETQIDRQDAVDMLKTKLVGIDDLDDPILQKMTDKMYETLITDEDFNDWADAIGASSAKIQLKQEIFKLTGTFVWNSLDSTKIREKEFQIIMRSYYPFEFSPASVFKPKMMMQIRGNVNVLSDNIYNVQVEDIEIL